MNNNAKEITIIILVSIFVSSIATYSWNNQTISEQVEEHNIQVLENCLSKARAKTTSNEILRATKDCNENILTKISKPKSMENITGTASTTPVSSVPLGFQLIPQASAKQLSTTFVEKTTNQEKELNEKDSSNVTAKIRTPFQIYELVKHLGYREAPTISLIRTCKGSSSDVQKCILVGLVLMYNEAGNQQKSKACIDRNNCFGIQSGKKVYSSLDEGMENWVQKFNKYWYKAESASFFYSSEGKVSPSRYCTSEDSSGSSVGCPRGLSIATNKWKQLYTIIYNSQYQ